MKDIGKKSNALRSIWIPAFAGMTIWIVFCVFALSVPMAARGALNCDALEVAKGDEYQFLSMWDKFKLLSVCSVGFSDITFEDSSKTSYLQALAYYLGVFFGTALTAIGALFTLLIIRGGWFWLTAQGNEEQVKKAKDTLRNASLGLGVIIFLGVIFAFMVYIYMNAAVFPQGG